MVFFPAVPQIGALHLCYLCNEKNSFKKNIPDNDMLVD